MVTEPNVAPLPPHITLKQARHFMGALAKGDPEAGSVVVDTARQRAMTECG
jgi:pyruvate dehydrogenase (quinone)